MNQDELRKCKDTWQATLASFGVRRGIMQSEEVEIARAITRHGAEFVEQALYGARFEPQYDKFNPATCIKITRILCKDREGNERIDRFVNLGVMERQKIAEKEQAKAKIRSVNRAAMKSPLETEEEFEQRMREEGKGA